VLAAAAEIDAQAAIYRRSGGSVGANAADTTTAAFRAAQACDASGIWAVPSSGSRKGGAAPAKADEDEDEDEDEDASRDEVQRGTRG